MDKISIILPVYKVEKYIDRCLESIVKQTYGNLEIILVDDGSPDNSGQRCDEWAKKDNRIKVIHKENGGVSSARNVGIENATGDFIAFIDPDDFIDITMFEKMIQSLKENNADLSMCGYSYVYDNGDIFTVKEVNLPKLAINKSYDYFILQNNHQEDNVIYTENIMGTVCRLLIKKDVLTNIRFMKVSICEDLLFVIDVFNVAQKISVVDESLYFYYQRRDGATVTCNESKIENHKNFSKIFIEKMKGHVDEDLYQAMKFYLYLTPITLCLSSGNKTLLKKVVKDEFLQSMNTKANYKSRLKITNSFSKKVLYFLMHHKMYGVCSLIYKLFKK